MEQLERESNQVIASQVDAFAAMEAGQALEKYTYIPQELGPMDVAIDITHCGVCHSDLHLINNDWGISIFPLVPGHEVVGVVSRVGNDVQEMLGQRVGVGWLAGVDFTCEQCVRGQDNLCPNSQPTCVGREGGYARQIQIDARFAFPIPDAIASEHAAPLLCAGVTMFAPLVRHVSGPARIGVIGIGGLGHLALQYGRALGYHVTAFSSSPEKEDAARAFGAHEFVDTSRTEALARQASTCDFILSTAPFDAPWGEYVNALRPNGKLCLVAGPESGRVDLPAAPLAFGQRSVVGSLVGSRSDMQAMLAFSAQHNIVPKTEPFPMDQVNRALGRLSKNQIRYRAVLVND